MTFSSLKTLSVAFAGTVLALSTATEAFAATLTFPINTGITGKPGIISGDPDPAFTWNYTGNFDDPRYQAYTRSTGTWIMPDVFSNNDYGPDVPDDFPDFQGVAFLYQAFELPENATNIRLDFSRIAADDRVVVSLNDTNLGNFKIEYPPVPTSVSGIMTDANFNDVPMTFVPNGGSVAFNDQSAFNLGGRNLLTFWMNNTGTADPNVSAGPFQLAGDGAVLEATGVLSYDVPESIPESSPALGLLALGILGVGSLVRRKR